MSSSTDVDGGHCNDERALAEHHDVFIGVLVSGVKFRATRTSHGHDLGLQCSLLGALGRRGEKGVGPTVVGEKVPPHVGEASQERAFSKAIKGILNGARCWKLSLYDERCESFTHQVKAIHLRWPSYVDSPWV